MVFSVVFFVHLGKCHDTVQEMENNLKIAFSNSDTMKEWNDYHFKMLWTSYYPYLYEIFTGSEG